MATWQYEFFLGPSDRVCVRDLKNDLSTLLPMAVSWAKSILIWGDIDGNRVQLCDDGTPPELSVRVDLRTDSGQFIRDIVGLATKMGLHMTNPEGIEIPLTFKDIADDIAKSDAFRFVTSPEQFLDSLRN